MKNPPRTARLFASLLAVALATALPPAISTSAAEPPAAAASGTSPHGWKLSSTHIDPKDSHHAFVGNGYLGQRVPPTGTGYAETTAKTGWPLFTPRYDGSFVSGLYAHNKRTTENRQVAAAIPTWTPLTVSTGGTRPAGRTEGARAKGDRTKGAKAETFSATTPTGRISHYRQTLDRRRGLVRTALTWTASDGRATDLVYDVLADRENPHVGAVRMRMTPHWSGDAKVTDLIDGRGARRVSQTGGGARSGGRTMAVAFRTDGTKTAGTVASTLRAGDGVRTRSEQRAARAKDLSARQHVAFPVRSGRSYELTKYVGVDTALTSKAPERDAVTASQRAADRGWPAMFAAHSAAWRKLWRTDIEVRGHSELQSWVRSAQYGLLSSTRTGSADSIAPTGLSSDNYAGLIFWDAETWMYPALLAGHPELAKSVVDYRYRTRAGARANARKLGYPGLFYPWTSASKGDLKSECHSVDPPHCNTQNHLQSDVALAAWQYYLATKDTDWLRTRGWPMIKGVAEFWAGRATRNSDDSYSIKNVAGPDEYSNGVDDGVFTNAGAATTLRTATRVAKILGHDAPSGWNSLAGKLRIPYDAKKKVFTQYAGYKGSVIKQADTVLLTYPLEWPMSKKAATNTLDYYAARTDPDGPAMTDSVHAIDAAAIGEPGCSTYTYLKRSIQPFVRGPFEQFSEARGDKAGASDPLSGSPAQDFLTGKGGFLQTFTNGLTGQRLREDRVHLDPMLPPQLKDGVTLRGLRWQGRTYDIAIGAHQTTVRLTHGDPFEVEGPQGGQLVSADAPAVLKTRRPDLEPTANLARCRTAKASSEQPGLYASAALDGNTATPWTPEGRDGTLTADLGRASRISGVTPRWTDTKPASYTLRTSVDGKHWRDVKALDGSRLARFVRVTVHAADAKKPAGVAELTVKRAE
ncbi:discoidin domain-containing protein [Streptomyces sp. H27-D2]|uniref:discoidin domain-containing protein n=1 Tax=Streptomyces sp. H27-D2 TaxID=3046304 RepID=UPI002DB57226|nr:discoidin domain-containing protein [Streptomyces sp. H27-D2]MEC4020311.1 discoidin domain-containing protein [Streptomyces sp. H27-D2]